MDLIYRSPKNPNSHLTVKERVSPSYSVRKLFEKGLIKGRALDFGCGLGVDVDYLRNIGVDCIGFDPHYFPERPQGKFDTILYIYVLNVLLPEEQGHVLMAVSELLKTTGTAYFTVMRDLKYNGFRTHIKNGANIYQTNVLLPYQSILTADHCEIYEYKPFNSLTRNNDETCVFCQLDRSKTLITESATAIAFLIPSL